MLRTLVLVLLTPLVLTAAELPAGRYRAVTLQEQEDAPVRAHLFRRLAGEVGSLEIEHVGDDQSLIRSGGQMLWRQTSDEATATYSASWTEGPEIFTRRIIIPFHAEDGIRIGGVVDEWSGGRRVERVLVLVAAE